MISFKLVKIHIIYVKKNLCSHLCKKNIENYTTDTGSFYAQTVSENSNTFNIV